MPDAWPWGYASTLGRIADYHGVDVQPELIEWADANLAGPGFRFTCVDVSNERYNPDGTPERTLATEPGHGRRLLRLLGVLAHERRGHRRRTSD